MKNLLNNPGIYFLVFLFVWMSSSYAQNPIIGYTYKGAYNGHVYYLSDCASDWNNANAAATEMGGYLVAIGDYSENFFVKYLVDDYTWIGLRLTNIGLSWTNGEPVGEAGNFIFNFEVGDLTFSIEPVQGMYWSEYYGTAISHPYLIEFDSNPDCNNPNKQYVCHNGNTICVNNSAVQNHLSHGDYLGPCSGCNNPNAFQAQVTNPTIPDENNVHVASANYVPLAKDRPFEIYPNPASDILQVSIPVSKSPAEIIIRDQVGKVIWTSKLSAQMQVLEIQLNSIHVFPGIYFISCMAEGVLQTKRLVVTK